MHFLFETTFLTVIFSLGFLVATIAILCESFTLPSVVLLATGAYLGYRGAHNEITNWLPVWIGLIAYLPIGVLFAGWRYNTWLHAESLKYGGEYKRQDRWESLSPSRYRGRIIGWIFYWPFCILSYFLTDVIGDFKNWLFDRCASFFVRIHNSHKDRPTQ